ncbi:MAG: glycosyltransferase [Paludibacteraceae bacterium]|jgi:D-inositol-3-phosphate glycosyltransferase|nr:glycosyltransferase [Paludibacteraceae bacterium]OQA49210.1 MAG: D-inositol 3-phosphate glycosyltransferase [Bacteroidetes bacterium ADurb.Bin302]HPG55748.1 glycosyltransferase [Candidatus Enterocola sp.]
MKIIILGTAHPYRGGLAAFNNCLAEQFVKEGHDVTLYTFTLQYPSLLFPGKTQYTNDEAPKNISILRRINSINPFNWISVGREIRKQKPDIVIFAYWMSFMAPCYGVIAQVIKKDPAIKCISLVHNFIPHEPSLLDKILPKYFVKKMDAFVAMSESVATDLTRAVSFNVPVKVTPHPIYNQYGNLKDRNEALSHLRLDHDFRYVLFFGFIRPYKGLDLLLEAMSDSRLNKYSVKLIVAGEFYGNPQPYYDSVKKMNIVEKVEWFNRFIPDAEVSNFFSAGDILVLPYKSATQSGVTQIAYHFEKPMLVTKVGGLSDMVPEGKVGYVVEPNPSSIADALVDFFEFGDENRFKEGLISEKDKYSWSKMTRTIISIEI